MAVGVPRFELSGNAANADTVWYTHDTLTLTGVSDQAALRSALAAVRTWQVPCPAGQDGGISSYCGRINAGSYDRIPARYRQIFQGRPGFPALAAPWVALLGPPGMIVAMFIALAGFCAALASGVTVLGGNRSAALVTVAAAMLTPIGFWATRILPEGAVLAGIALSASGASLVLRRARPELAVAVAVAGLWATLAMKSASGVALAGGLILIMVWNAWRRRTTARWSVSLALLALGSVAVWQILSVALGWPGLSDTVQDMLTRHFTRPDAADPWAGWFRLLTHATLDWMRFWAAVLVGPVLVVGGAVVAYARFGYPALPWLAGGATGVIVAVVHPLTSDAARLSSATWLTVALAGGVVAELLTKAWAGWALARATDRAQPGPTP